MKYFIFDGIMYIVVYLIGEVLGKGVKVLLIQITARIVVYALELLIIRDRLFV